MADYKCKCNKKVVSKSSVTIRYVEGKGAVNDVQCEKCGEEMELTNPKSGVPGFRSNRFGQTF
jgi:RNase P subunit RPR2